MKRNKRNYEIEIRVNFIPFPNEERRRESYRKWVRAFLSSKFRKSRHVKPHQNSRRKSFQKTNKK